MAPALLLLALGCDRDGTIFVPQPNPDFPFIQDLGEFRVIGEDEQSAFLSYADEFRADDELGRHGVHYGGLGAPADPSYYGGATFNFKGTGGDVCVVMDPESVFWNQAQAVDATTSDFLYLDNTQDDGDLDLDVGLTAYYTGSPGVEMGDFEIAYSDPSGEDHSLSFSQCAQQGYRGNYDSNAGRSSVEYCTVDTSALLGVDFTGVIDTFALPIDDSVTNFAVAVLDGNCGKLTAASSGINECFLAREADGALDVGEDEATEEYCSDPDHEWNFACLETAYCGKTKGLNRYCEDHFDDDDAPCIDNGVHPPADDAASDAGAGPG